MNHALLPNAQNANLPATYEAAKIALANCNRIDECKDWSDKAQALASYARQSEDKEMETTAMRIRARAIRRCGELLKEIEKGHGKNQNISSGIPTNVTRKEAANQAGLSKDQAVTAIRVANVPEETFTEQIESDSPPTITSLAQQGTQPMKKPPMFEQLGMTKQAFQAGMYFRGDIEDFCKATKKYEIQDIIDGSSTEQRDRLRTLIKQIDTFTDKLIAKL